MKTVYAVRAREDHLPKFKRTNVETWIIYETVYDACHGLNPCTHVGPLPPNAICAPNYADTESKPFW